MRLRASLGADETREVEVHRDGDLYTVIVDGTAHEADVRKLESDFYSILVGGRSYEISVESDGEEYKVRHGAAVRTIRLVDPLKAATGSDVAAAGKAVVSAVMPGKVVRLLVQEGQDVEEGQGLLVLEAMKMENEVSAPKSGTIISLGVEAGAQVEGGAELAVIE